eukprot:6214002-Pleurochrysis_carterae.AAC.2
MLLGRGVTREKQVDAEKKARDEKWEVRVGPNVKRGELHETCSSLGFTTDNTRRVRRGCTDHALFNYCSTLGGVADVARTCINYTPMAGNPEETLLKKLHGSNNGCWVPICRDPTDAAKPNPTQHYPREYTASGGALGCICVKLRAASM